ncbi:MAG: enterotoxin [Verrucomicrobia bacterium]|nr:enterotoxin [Verrucomicrobiota bacterium]
MIPMLQRNHSDTRVAFRDIVAATTLLMASLACALEFPDPPPGAANARLADGQLTMENNVLRATWSLTPGRFGLTGFQNRMADQRLASDPSEAFVLKLADGQCLRASEFRLAGKPKLEKIAAQPKSLRQAEHFAGWRASVELATADGHTCVRWQATLRDGSNYIRQEATLLKHRGAQPVELTLLRLRAPQATTIGSAIGSPVVAKSVFMACEHPLAKNVVENGEVCCSVPRCRPLAAGQSWSSSAVIGVVPNGQLRRAFLYYIERERVRPYRPFVYYISWFDLAGPGMTMNEKQCLDTIEAFGEPLVRQRGAKLDAFVFDDGWDNPKTLWKFHDGFPKGFAPLRAAAARYGAILGTWISPWGGYGKLKAERLKYGKEQGFETNRSGFSLAGPKYYQRYRDVCANMLRHHGVGYLKFDGMASGIMADGPGADYGPDVEAMLDLLAYLRGVRRDLFVNTTVGTWPSPYWLWHSDMVWRGGHDTKYAGVGSKRQQWMTYRDSLGYGIRTRRGPLYPFNSLKFQSFICAQLSLAADLNNDPKDLLDDLHMAAASGTQLQEFFVTARLMPAEVWDATAKAIRWVQHNADVLVDSHGIGGDPEQGEVYGFASWSPRMGIITLRNPGAQPARLSVDIREAFELPPGAPRRYATRSTWKPSPPAPVSTMEAGKPHTFQLAPFEVLTLEATPQ